jgi:hypothetical protein
MNGARSTCVARFSVITVRDRPVAASTSTSSYCFSPRVPISSQNRLPSALQRARCQAVSETNTSTSPSCAGRSTAVIALEPTSMM